MLVPHIGFPWHERKAGRIPLRLFLPNVPLMVAYFYLKGENKLERLFLAPLQSVLRLDCLVKFQGSHLWGWSGCLCKKTFPNKSDCILQDKSILIVFQFSSPFSFDKKKSRLRVE